ncbi:MAG: 5'-deoxyadenosine deaminase [Melioribacteraceae bacterium]|nr:5'-deoxyadenosine deaminase [Melioribacteraceae bacterium]
MRKKKIVIIPKAIITANDKDDVLRNYAVEIENGKIINIFERDNVKLKNYDGMIFSYPNHILIPGFVQTHTHLCQTLFRGLADDLELLDWLTKKIFPYENSHTKESLRLSARLGLCELQTSGTTTILDMGTINHQESVFEELNRFKMRAIAGKCMVDKNDLYLPFKQTTNDCLRETKELAESYHNSNNGKIKYGFAPRFVLSCTEYLLKETKEIMKDFDGSVYHTHSSENKNEILEVKKMYGMENVEFLNSLGILSNNTVLAHCIHLSDKEKELLKNTNTKVAHCPSSNLKLGSGIAEIPNYIKEGISVSIGADGAPCNNNLSMLTEMRLAALIQKPIFGPTAMDAKTVFRLATIEGAKALNLENEIGSIEVGKKADLVLMDMDKVEMSVSESDESLYSNIVYSSSKNNISEVMIEGDWVVSKGKSLLTDELELVIKAKEELKKLLKRTTVN